MTAGPSTRRPPTTPGTRLRAAVACALGLVALGLLEQVLSSASVLAP